MAIGYSIALVKLDPEGKTLRHEVFASGWLRNANTVQQQFWGRPANLLFLPDDGSLLVSDDFAGAVYRITYTGQGAGKRGGAGAMGDWAGVQRPRGRQLDRCCWPA